MNTEVLYGIIIPFAGTTLGAAMVLFLKNGLRDGVRRALTGFAAGVMVAAAVWSLLIPSIEQAEGMGKFAFLPAVVGFFLGMGFLLLLDKIVPHMHMDSECEGPKCGFKKSTMMLLAVTMHNLPEGMAVGVVYAGATAAVNAENTTVTLAGALALTVGIAVQNFPEGAIISIPLREDGMSRGKAFLMGTLSGLAEPLGALLTILAAPALVPVMPYLLSFAAGAMLYVVVEELIPEMSEHPHSNIGTVSFAVGFAAMMMLDVLLG